MRIIDKIKGHGISYKAAKDVVLQVVFIACYHLCSIFPIHKNRIILESEGDFTDNAQAFYQYLKDHGYTEKYDVIWLADDPKKLRKEEKVKAVSKRWGAFKFNTAYYLATTKYYIYDHNNLYYRFDKRKGQILVNLWHGFGFKWDKAAEAGKSSSGRWAQYDFMVATGPVPAGNNSKIKTLGYPRTDYFYSDLSDVKKKINARWHFEDYKKIFLWMPTFRKCENAAISDDCIKNETGLPIFNNQKELEKFDLFLVRHNILFVLKVHHLQAELPVFHCKFNNILVITDKELAELKIKLFQFIPSADAMVTDYSAASIDFLPLDRPIIFTLDDYEEYNASRSLRLEIIDRYMKGHHVYNLEDLQNACMDVLNGLDPYGDERRKIVGQFYTYLDGNSSRRLAEYLHL